MIAQGKHQWRSGGPMMGRVYAFPHHRPKAASWLLAWFRRRKTA